MRCLCNNPPLPSLLHTSSFPSFSVSIIFGQNGRLLVLLSWRQSVNVENMRFCQIFFCLSVTFPSWPTFPLHPWPVYGPVALQSTAACLAVAKYFFFFFFFNFLKIKRYMLDWHRDSFTNYWHVLKTLNLCQHYWLIDSHVLNNKHFLICN